MSFTEPLDQRRNRLGWIWLFGAATVLGVYLTIWCLIHWSGWRHGFIGLGIAVLWLSCGIVVLTDSLMKLFRPTCLEISTDRLSLHKWYRTDSLSWSDVRQIQLRTLQRGGPGWGSLTPCVTIIGESSRLYWEMLFSLNPRALVMRIQDAAKAAGYDAKIDSSRYREPIPQINLRPAKKSHDIIARFFLYGLLACVLGFWLWVTIDS